MRAWCPAGRHVGQIRRPRACRAECRPAPTGAIVGVEGAGYSMDASRIAPHRVVVPEGVTYRVDFSEGPARRGPHMTRPRRWRGPSLWRDPDSNWGHHDFQSSMRPWGMSRVGRGDGGNDAGRPANHIAVHMVRRRSDPHGLAVPGPSARLMQCAYLANTPRAMVDWARHFVTPRLARRPPDRDDLPFRLAPRAGAAQRPGA